MCGLMHSILHAVLRFIFSSARHISQIFKFCFGDSIVDLHKDNLKPPTEVQNINISPLGSKFQTQKVGNAILEVTKFTRSELSLPAPKFAFAEDCIKKLKILK